jgi:hypothetical protein
MLTCVLWLDVRGGGGVLPSCLTSAHPDVSVPPTLRPRPLSSTLLQMYYSQIALLLDTVNEKVGKIWRLRKKKSVSDIRSC